jgi:hypothetical protein
LGAGFPPAPHSQQKSGWGSGGENPSGGAGGESPCRCEAPLPSFLDPIEINRNKPEGRGKHCGRFSIRGYDSKTDTQRHHRVNCKCWNCSYCGPRKAKRYRYAIRTVAEANKLRRFLTLTLDPSKIDGDPVRYLNRIFAAFRVYLQRRYSVTPQYIRILEFQVNGNPHFHILIDRYIERNWIVNAWSALGGGAMVDIRYVDVHRVSRYLSKYLTKELLLSAPLRSRRVTTSRGIKLFLENATDIKWTLIRTPIWVLFEQNADRILAASFDEEHVLESFVVFGTIE